MTELIQTSSPYTNSLSKIDGNTESFIFLTGELESQKEQMQPVVDFYDRLVKGWHGRILRAELAMKDPLNQSPGQQKVFQELRNIAKNELENFLPVLREVQKMQEELSERIREFDMMRLKPSAPQAFNINVSDSFKQTKELLHRADALIELRKEG